MKTFFKIIIKKLEKIKKKINNSLEKMEPYTKEEIKLQNHQSSALAKDDLTI